MVPHLFLPFMTLAFLRVQVSCILNWALFGVTLNQIQVLHCGQETTEMYYVPLRSILHQKTCDVTVSYWWCLLWSLGEGHAGQVLSRKISVFPFGLNIICEEKLWDYINILSFVKYSLRFSIHWWFWLELHYDGYKMVIFKKNSIISWHFTWHLSHSLIYFYMDSWILVLLN